MRGKDDLDSLLDAALATYADPGQTDGLAERVLVSVRQAHGRRRSGRWLLWMAGIPALAGLALAAFLLLHHPVSPSHTIASASHAVRPQIFGHADAAGQDKSNAAGMRPAATRLTRARWSGVRATAHEQMLPKLEVFPTPTSLSEEERALAGLVNQNPATVGQSLAETQRKIDEPIQLTAIQIPPINPPDQGGN